MKLLESIYSWLTKRREHRVEGNRIVLSNESFSFLHGSHILFDLRGGDVKEIVAYKENLFGCDSICIGFRTSESDEYFRVFEEAAGYNAMLTELENRFPGIRTDWFNEVAFPAFVPNWTTIWGEPFANKPK